MLSKPTIILDDSVPRNRDIARREGKHVYLDGGGCTSCRSAYAYRYVLDDSCEDCLRRSAYEKYDALMPRSRKEALETGRASYYAFKGDDPQLCPRGPHLMRKNVRGGLCIECGAQPGVHPRATARNAGLLEYLDDCDTCRAETAHSVPHGKCLVCYRTDGLKRARPAAEANPRALARRAGVKTYAAACPECAMQTDHSVMTGKCLVCFRTDGARRSTRTATPRNPRAAARQDGRATYPGFCPDCDIETTHSVRYGQCLKCCTVDGRERVRIAAPKRDPARAAKHPRAQPPRKTNPRPIPQEWAAVIAAMPGGLMEWAQAQALESPLYRGADGVLRWVDTHLEADAERDRYRWG